jgi:hypothetical protein
MISAHAPASTPTRLLRLAAVALALALPLSACASSGASSTGATDTSPASSRDRLTPEDFAAQPDQNLFQAIRRLRNHWLRPRGAGTSITQNAAEIVVYVDGQRSPGGVEDLRRFRVLDVAGVEYLNSSRATTRFGIGHNAGAIMVTIG